MGVFPTWESHQYPNNKEHDSKLPEIRQGRILKGPITQSMLTVHARLSEETLFAHYPGSRTRLSTREDRVTH